MAKRNSELGSVLRQQRRLMDKTAGQLAAESGVSASHIIRVEKGERFPSATVLKKLGEPLGFEENELFVLAGYLSDNLSTSAGSFAEFPRHGLDPYVARVLSQEPLEIQRVVISIVTILKKLASIQEQ